MFKIISISGGAYGAPPEPLVTRGFLLFGNHSFAPSVLAISTTSLFTVYLAPHRLKPNSIKGRWPMRMGENCTRGLGSMGGDLGGTGGAGPPQNLRWGMAHASIPLNILRSNVIGCEA